MTVAVDAADVLAGVGGRDRLAVEQQLDLARAVLGAEDAGTPAAPGSASASVASPSAVADSCAHVPGAAVGELVEAERGRVDACRSPSAPGCGAVDEPLRAGEAEVGLGRAQARVGASRPRPPASPRRRARPSPASASSERIASSVSLVVALAEVDVADLALGVDQVLRRPVLVRERGPGAELVVLDHRVARSRSRRSRRRRCRRPSRTRTRARARRRSSARRRGTRSSHDRRYGQRADAVDAGVGPEVDQHDPALALGQARRSRAARRPRC